MSSLKRSIFLRLINIEDKKTALLDLVNYPISVTSNEFNIIPNSPFSYWITKDIREIYKKFPAASDTLAFATGASTKDDFRFLRLLWEISPEDIAISRESSHRGSWVRFAKGGAYSEYYSDIYLLIYWKNDGELLKDYLSKYRDARGWGPQWSAELKGYSKYFKGGATYSSRTQKGLSLRYLPEGCIFSIKGPLVSGNVNEIEKFIGIINSTVGKYLSNIQSAFGSYEIGVVSKIPVPSMDCSELSAIVKRLFMIKLDTDSSNENSSIFRAPISIKHKDETLKDRYGKYLEFMLEVNKEYADLQGQANDIVSRLYELSNESRSIISEAANRQGNEIIDFDEYADEITKSIAEEDEEEESATGADPAALSHALLSWCVGAAFGRWDVRMALDQRLIPALQGPFEHLPVVAPAGLVGVDGFPAQAGQVAPVDWLLARPNVISLPAGAWRNTDEYPVRVAWNGILVSDQGGANDLSTRVREVLTHVFGEQAEAIEEEALQAIQEGKKGTLTLEEYLRQPKRFFAEHLKGYSRSRRKAPIYWPLVHKDAPGFVVWIYYPRMDAQTLPQVLTEVVLPRLDVARADVGRLRADRATGDNAGMAQALEQAEDFERGLLALADELRRVVDAGYTPEHDDGVILSAAPLHAIFPWKDLAPMFRSLENGKYPWSHQHGIWAGHEGAGQ